MSKVCFVISPCKEAGYDALRAERGVGRDIVTGTNTALQNAPMGQWPIWAEPILISPSDRSDWNVINVGHCAASPAEPAGVAQPATRRR